MGAQNRLGMIFPHLPLTRFDINGEVLAEVARLQFGA